MGAPFAQSLCFNTQPPEGGWTSILVLCIFAYVFQHTAARRRLVSRLIKTERFFIVSTHSRPKAAGDTPLKTAYRCWVSTHSRPKAAGYQKALYMIINECFNTQPPEGGWTVLAEENRRHLSFNTQPPEGGWIKSAFTNQSYKCFNTQPPEGGWR